ncbi:pyridoxal phosphate-dependent aminotransferase [Ornithinicoccus hortensis]|uniref:Aminotransferase n=1 Tax=Ornithinicoccus hortensis TaxID=82346 RepID=A0A542YLV1_9MICO|nr:pyridoxal phosphate-dependent aminotransferase [Ornithinicoccus hortensis]TQL49053.1 aspartate aminotransferase/aminotransferase/aminotransferase [Ornithinicoccus hortensis]
MSIPTITGSARVSGLRPSTIRAMAVGAPGDTIDLGLGVPGWDLPEPARRALSECASTPGPLGYGPNEGLPELVTAIAAHHGLPGVNGDAGESARRVMVTSGAQAALYAVFQAHVSPGQRVLVSDPGFPAYGTLAALAGGEPVRYRLGPCGELDPAEFARALEETDGVALAVLNHPGNPTGGGASREALTAVATAARAAGVLLLSDEVYREVHLGRRPLSLHDVTESGVVVSSASKGWAAPGLRVGWAVGDPDLLAPARLVHNSMTTAAAIPGQRAAAALLRHSPDVLRDTRRQLIARWSVAQTAPEPVRARYTPAGGFYLWLPLPEWALADPLAHCRRVRDEGRVVVVPGTAFGPGGAGHVRVSCGGDPKALAEGLTRMAPFWERP